MMLANRATLAPRHRLDKEPVPPPAVTTTVTDTGAIGTSVEGQGIPGPGTEAPHPSGRLSSKSVLGRASSLGHASPVKASTSAVSGNNRPQRLGTTVPTTIPRSRSNSRSGHHRNHDPALRVNTSLAVATSSVATGSKEHSKNLKATAAPTPARSVTPVRRKPVPLLVMKADSPNVDNFKNDEGNARPGGRSFADKTIETINISPSRVRTLQLKFQDMSAQAERGPTRERVSLDVPIGRVRRLSSNCEEAQATGVNAPPRREENRNDSMQDVQSSKSLSGSAGSTFGFLTPHLTSKKRGSDTSIRSSGAISSSASSPPSSSGPSRSSSPAASFSTMVREQLSFSKKEVPPTPTTPIRSMVSTLFRRGEGRPNESSMLASSLSTVTISAPFRPSFVKDSDRSMTKGDPITSVNVDGVKEDWKGPFWDLNRSIPSSGYDDEDFALWIKPSAQARKTESGVDLEERLAGSMASTPTTAGINTESKSSTLYEPCKQDDKKRRRPELEDLDVLEEVLDFVLIILLRVSANLYPFIQGAHSRSINFDFPWQPFGQARVVIIRSLKSYQNIVMEDIGYAIKIMTDIYEQQIRPFGHIDNQGRDVRQEFGPQYPPLTSPSIYGNPKPDMIYSSVPSPGPSSAGTTISQGRSYWSQAQQSLQKKCLKANLSHQRLNDQQSDSKNKHGRRRSLAAFSSIANAFSSSLSHHSPSVSQYFTFSRGSSTPVSFSYSGCSTPLPFSPSMHPSYVSLESRTNGLDGFGAPSTGGCNGNNRLKPTSFQTLLATLLNPGSTSSGPHGLSPMHEEKRAQMEHRWRVDIMRRKASIRAWCCRQFTALYEFSLRINDYEGSLEGGYSLEDEFQHLYRITRSIVDIDMTAKSHDALAETLLEQRAQLSERFQLKYSPYRTAAPTAQELSTANEAASNQFETQYRSILCGRLVAKMESLNDNSGGATQAQVSPPLIVIEPKLERDDVSDEHSSETEDLSNACAYENMELYQLQEHSLWEPLLDRLTKFDSTHHSLDPRNIFQFLRRMSLQDERLENMTEEIRDELLAVLWVIERCIRERSDYQQSPTWFRQSSSVSAVQAIYNSGGIMAYMRDIAGAGAGKGDNNVKSKDPIQLVNPVTLTGYFKRLLKEAGGLLLKETTGLFVELARPATDNGDFWNLEQLSRIDRALLYRVICLDRNRGQVFLRISRVMEKILKSSPPEMELDAFALTKMAQVVELSGVLDLKSLRRWNGAWSAIILGYM